MVVESLYATSLQKKFELLHQYAAGFLFFVSRLLGYDFAMHIRTHISLRLILFLYLIMGMLFAVRTPAWQAPDEPAHYNYVRQLAARHFPVMEPGDYDETYKNEMISAHFAPQYDVRLITYEDWQPPLYYLLLTPVFWLTSGSLLALRLTSVLMGAGIVFLAYGVAWRLFRGQRWVAAGTAVFVAFLPQHLAILASVNNDALAELLIAFMLWQIAQLGYRQYGEVRTGIEKRWALLLGVVLGLGFLTKGTVYPMAGVIGLVLLRHWWRDWRGLVQAGLWVFVPAFLLGGLWWGRNIFLYGGLDILGKATHDTVVVGQPRTAVLLAQVGFAGAMLQLGQTTFHSFWGQFGWMALPMLNPGWLYPLLWVFSAFVCLGLVVNWFTSRHAVLAAPNSPLIWVLPLLFLLTVGVYIGYNITFIQHQGRYLFPALIPMGAGVMVGLGVWIRPLTSRWPQGNNLLPIGLAFMLMALDLWAVFRIIPNLA